MVRVIERRTKKKLEDAARAWLSCGVKDEVADDLAAFGAPAELVAREQTPVNPPCEVYEENWPIVEMFLRLQTQWVLAPMGGIFGLNYQSVEFAFKIYGIEDRRRFLEGLQVMEFEVKRVLSEREKE